MPFAVANVTFLNDALPEQFWISFPVYILHHCYHATQVVDAVCFRNKMFVCACSYVKERVVLLRLK
jgi:hypothetical protein